jgi:hypothetical protein
MGLCATLTVGCGSAALPTEHMTAAKASVAAAEAAGANDEPSASLKLKHARDQIEQAEKLIAEEEYESAEWLLRRAAVDAEVALNLAEEAKTANDAMKAKEDLERLRRELTAE